MSEFKLGQRVAVYDESHGLRGAYGAIYSVGVPCVQVVMDGDQLSLYCHPKQLRRLKPRGTKAAPVKARKFWINFHQCSEPRVRMHFEKNIICGSGCEIEQVLVREILPGEVVVSYETLAKAWIENVGQPLNSPFKDLLKDLGLSSPSGSDASSALSEAKKGNKK